MNKRYDDLRIEAELVAGKPLTVVRHALQQRYPGAEVSVIRSRGTLEMYSVERLTDRPRNTRRHVNTARQVGDRAVRMARVWH